MINASNVLLAQVPAIGTSSIPDQSTPVFSTESGTSSTPDQTVAIVSNESGKVNTITRNN